MVLGQYLLLTAVASAAVVPQRRLVSVKCDNSCFFPDDGECDDGFNSDWGWCDLGTDCNDCGTRYLHDDWHDEPFFDEWDPVTVNYGSYGSYGGSDPVDMPVPPPLQFACFDVDGDGGYHQFAGCEASGLQIAPNQGIECASDGCTTEECCVDIPPPGSKPSPSPSPSPSPTVFAESPVVADVVMEGVVGLMIECDKLTDTKFLQRSIASNIRSGLVQGGVHADETTVPDSSVNITEARCGSVEIAKTGRRLSPGDAEALVAKYEVVIPAEKAAEAGIRSLADVELIEKAIEDIGSKEGSSANEFLEKLSETLAEDGIIIESSAMIVMTSKAQDTTQYAAALEDSAPAQAPASEESGIEVWAVAVIAVAVIAMIALIVGAVHFFRRAHRTDDFEDRMTYKADEGDDERSFEQTKAPHVL